MAEDRCIICGEKKRGIRVREDWMINLIRWFKRNVTRSEKGYGLVVCKEDYQRYYKMRKRFESRRALYLALGIVFTLLMLFVSQNRLTAIVYGVIVILFFYLLAHLNYMPALEMPKGGAAREKGRRGR